MEQETKAPAPLTLKPVTGFKVIAKDAGCKYIIGYYKTDEAARMAASLNKRVAVQELTLWTDGANLYDLTPLEGFEEDKAERDAKMVEYIKAELSPEAIAFIKKNPGKF